MFTPMMAPAAHRKTRHAFTLLELLAVIAIVAVLLLLLLPLYRQWVEQAQAAKCSANLRSMGVAMQLYSSDNNGYLPLGLGKNGIPIISRGGPIAPYLGSFDAQTPLEVYRRTAPVYCPAAAGGPGISDLSHIYVPNIDILGWNNATGTPIRRRDEVEDPAIKIILAEGSSSFDSTPGGYIKAWHEALFPVHGATFNALYADGHVAPVRLEDITEDNVKLK